MLTGRQVSTRLQRGCNTDQPNHTATLAALAYRDMKVRRNRLAAKLAETKAEHFEWIWDVRAPGLGNDEDIFNPTGAALSLA